MIVSKLKDIYARKILGEQDEVKIFKQDPDQDAVEHIATLDKVYYNNVLKRALKANDVSGEEIDSILFKESIKKAGLTPGSDIANSFAVFIKETGMTFKKENQEEFAKILKLYGESSDSGSLVEILTTCYKGNVSSHIPELTRLVKQKTEAKKGKAVGPGEIFFEIFAGGTSATVGDMELDGRTFEIKSVPGARLETERTEGASKDELGKKAAGGELEDIKDLVSVLAGYDIDDPGKDELISGALDSYIESRKNSIVRSIKTKYIDNRTLTQSDDLLRLVGFLQLKCYQLNKNFDFLLAFDCESTDVKIDLINSNIPVSQLLEKKKDWRFNYDWSTGSGYSTAMKIMAI
jgi:hypothetical protein